MSDTPRGAIAIEGDLVDVVARIYADGVRSGALSMVASSFVGTDLSVDDSRKLEVSGLLGATILRDKAVRTVAADPLLRAELVESWQAHADDVAAGRTPFADGGACSCQD